MAGGHGIDTGSMQEGDIFATQLVWLQGVLLAGKIEMEMYLG